MKNLAALILFLYFNSISCKKCSPTSTTVSGTKSSKKLCGGDLIFQDNFNSFDVSTWSHEKTLAGGGSWQFQWYDDNRANSFCENGVLYISPTLTSDYLGGEALLNSTHILIPKDQCTMSAFYGCDRRGTPSHIVNPIRSASIQTLNSFSFKYGIVEIRARVPSGDWLWPSITLLSREKKYGDWPRNGAITIMQSRGNSDLTLNGHNIGTRQVDQSLEFGWSYSATSTVLAARENHQGYDKEFHLFQLKWTPEKLTFSIDNQKVSSVSGDFGELGNLSTKAPDVSNPWTHKIAPFDQEFYISINLAVGGVNHFPDDAKNGHGKKPWDNRSPQAATDFWNGRNDWLPTWDLNGIKFSNQMKSSFQIDYVKVWALNHTVVTKYNFWLLLVLTALLFL